MPKNQPEKMTVVEKTLQESPHQEDSPETPINLTFLVRKFKQPLRPGEVL
jgi:hypothetical protein